MLWRMILSHLLLLRRHPLRHPRVLPVAPLLRRIARRLHARPVPHARRLSGVVEKSHVVVEDVETELFTDWL